MANKKPENITDEDEFMAAWTAASDNYEAAKAKVKEFAAEYDRRLTEDAARDRFEGLNDKERAALIALAQDAQADGIESEEAVHSG